MSFISGNSSDEAVQKFLEILQNDFRSLSNETKKKYPQIKEVRMEMLMLKIFFFFTCLQLNEFTFHSTQLLIAFHIFFFTSSILLQSCEEAIIKLKAAASTPSTQIYYVVNQILYALVQGCESKDVKIIKVRYFLRSCCF